MKKSSRMISLLLFICLAPQAWAQAADIGSKICRDVQLLAQDVVLDGEPYENHGKMVRTAANAQDPFLESGDITEECSSCIVSQFAHRLPIEEQAACGADRICGDGEVDPLEQCDDGNTDDGDGCSAQCMIEVVSCPCFDSSDIAGDGIDNDAQVLPDGACTDWLPDALQLKGTRDGSGNDEQLWVANAVTDNILPSTQCLFTDAANEVYNGLTGISEEEYQDCLSILLASQMFILNGCPPPPP